MDGQVANPRVCDTRYLVPAGNVLKHLIFSRYSAGSNKVLMS